MSRMFKTIDSTYNVYVGCKFDCTYCVARPMALGRLKNNPRYRGGFEPHLVESELRRKFKPGEFVMVSFMGDIAFATREEFLKILARIREFPETNFLIQTKNPERIFTWWHDWYVRLPDNAVFGTTIESNRDYGLSKAPPPHDRFVYLTGYPHSRKFVSIEPIMDFDLDTLVSWVRIIKPEIVEIGVDNYHNHLVEPPWSKVEALLGALRDICPSVIEKEGLERLRRC